MTHINRVPLDAIQDDQPAETSGAWVLNQVEAYLGRFVSYPSDHAPIAHALWIAHTHLMASWASTPRLAFISPERGSGKTRALEATEPLVPNPVHAVNVTPAYLFRKVGDDESSLPTILYDEVDTLFGSKVHDTGEVRGLLNAGHRRGAVAGRCVVIGNRVQTEEIPAYCAVALAGLGDLPDTIASRSILLEMRRRAPDEPVEPFRHSVHGSEGAAIRDLLANWCSEISSLMHDAKPSMPDVIKDRDADCWEPLFAIADAAGGDWPCRARAAAVSLVKGAADRTQTSGVQLLSDMREVFGEAEKLATRTILDRLYELPETPWADVCGRPLNDRGLATRLRNFGIKPKKLRITDNTLRGYEAADFHDAWKRYLLAPRQEAEQVEQAEQRPQSETAAWPENRKKMVLVPDVPHVPVFGERDTGVPHTAEAIDDFEERAAIREYDGGLTRAEAEAQAASEMPDLPDFLRRVK